MSTTAPNITLNLENDCDVFDPEPDGQSQANTTKSLEELDKLRTEWIASRDTRKLFQKAVVIASEKDDGAISKKATPSLSEPDEADTDRFDFSQLTDIIVTGDCFTYSCSRDSLSLEYHRETDMLGNGVMEVF